MDHKKTVKVGIISFLLFLAIGILILWKSDIKSRTSGYMIVGSFDNIGGLLKNADVRYRGYRVGRVGEIIPEPKEILVHFWINKDIKIPKQSSAKILFDGLVGENYIGIEPNPNASEFLRGGEKINGTSGSDLANFIDLGSQNMVHVESILNSIKRVLTSKKVSTSIGNILSDIESISSQVNMLIGGLNKGDNAENIQEILENLNAITARFNSESRDIFEQGNFSEQVNTIVHHLSLASKNINKSSKQAGSILDDNNTEKIKNILSNLESFTKALKALTYEEGDQKKEKKTKLRSEGILRAASKLKINTDAALSYAGAEKNAYYNAHVNFDAGKYFLRTGVGDRGGKNELITIQQGLRLNRKMVSRVGLFYKEPGLGLDYKLGTRTALSLELYNPNKLSIDIISKYALSPHIFLLANLRNNQKNHHLDSLDFGLHYGF